MAGIPSSYEVRCGIASAPFSRKRALGRKPSAFTAKLWQAAGALSLQSRFAPARLGC